MEADKLNEIFNYLHERQVKRSDIINLLCQIKGVKHKDIAQKIGIAREHLYQINAGQRPVNDAVRAAFKETLGLDPWENK